MPTPGVIKTDEIDQRIESRIGLMRDSIELSLSRALEANLENRFANSVRVIGAVFSAVALLFTGLGIKTLLDVRDIARTTAIDNVKQTLSIDDPNSKFRRQVDQLVARAMIDSYLMAISRNDTAEDLTEITIRDSDVDRLVAFIKDKKTNDRDFSDALTVLVRSAQAQPDSDVLKLLIDMGRASEKDFLWLKTSDKKRAAIFSEIPGDVLQAEARDIITSNSNSVVLQKAAIRYEARTKDLLAVEPIEKAAGRHGVVGSEALVALAVLDPNSVVLNEALNAPSKSDALREWGKKLTVMASLVRPTRFSIFFGRDAQANQRDEIATKVLKSAVDDGVIFQRSLNGSLQIALKKEPNRAAYVPTGVLKAADRPVQNLFRTVNSDVGALHRLMGTFCLASFRSNVCGSHIVVQLKGNGRIKVDAVTLDSSAVGPITLTSEGSAPDARIMANWSDRAGGRNAGYLTGIENLQTSEFRLSAEKLVDADADADDE